MAKKVKAAYHKIIKLIYILPKEGAYRYIWSFLGTCRVVSKEWADATIAENTF